MKQEFYILNPVSITYYCNIWHDEDIMSQGRNYRDIMRQYRQKSVLTEMIETLLEEQCVDDNGFVKDYVGTAVRHDGKYVRPSCRFTKEELFEVCPSCNINTSYFGHWYDKYPRAESMHTGKAVLEYAEPTVVNPCTYDNVKPVLKNIEEYSFPIGSNRKWVSVMCDGSPYVLGAIMHGRVFCLPPAHR